MKRFVVFNIILAIALLFAGLQPQPASASGSTIRYMILAKGQGKGSTSFTQAIQNAGGTITSNLEEIGVVFAETSNPNFVSTLKKNSNIQNISEDVEVNWLPENEPNMVMDESLDASLSTSLLTDSLGALQWNMAQIGADQTAANGDQGWGATRARVAVLDSGIVTNHPDIAPNLNLALSQSFVPGEGLNPPAGAFNHGTHVAGIIAAAKNGIGIQGVAPQAEIVAVKVLRASGSGSFEWAISGILYASGPAVDADVINMSLGATFDRINAGGDGAGPLLSALSRAINYATSQGTLVVSSAGNNGVNLNSRIFTIPAQSGNGMAVSATGPIGYGLYGFNAPMDRLASYSNYGQSVINVAAPGGDAELPGNDVCKVGPSTNLCWVFDMVISPGGYAVSNGVTSYRYYFAAGTSMAAPHVSGLAALIVGKYGRMAPAQLKAMIQNSAIDILKPGADPETGHGLINAPAALYGK